MQTTLPEFDFELILPAEPTNPDAKSQPIVENQEEDKDPEIILDSQEKAEPVTEEVAPQYGANADPKAIAVYEELKERGIYIEDPESPFDGTWEKIDENFDNLPQRLLNTVVAEAPELMKQVLRFTFSDPNITKEELANFIKVHLEDIENTTPESIETMDGAREFLEAVYKERGMRPSAIRASLDALEEDDVLIEEAKEEASKTKSTKTEQLIANKENENIAKEQAATQFVQKVSEELDALGWKPTRATKVKEVLSNNNLSTLLNTTVKNPKGIIKLADFLSYVDPKTGDVDYTAFMKHSETSANTAFKNRIENAVSSPTINTRSNSNNPTQLDKANLIPILD